MSEKQKGQTDLQELEGKIVTLDQAVGVALQQLDSLYDQVVQRPKPEVVKGNIGATSKVTENRVQDATAFIERITGSVIEIQNWTQALRNIIGIFPPTDVATPQVTRARV